MVRDAAQEARLLTMRGNPNQRRNKEEKADAAKTAFARRNERRTETNPRRGDRGKTRPATGADDGLAQQPGNGASCDAAWRGVALRHDISGQAVRDRDPHHRAALDLAL